MPRIIDWSSYDHLLGTMPDRKLARAIKCKEATIRSRRVSKGIPPPEYPAWTTEDDNLLIQGKQRCQTCNDIKEVECFPKTKKSRSGKRRHCISCDQTRQRDFRRKRKQEIVDKAGGFCQNCGFDKHLSPLQFHHVTKPKLFNPSVGSRKSYSLVEITTEIDKCCLLCSNCHDAFHGGELELQFAKRSIGWTVSNPWKNGSSSEHCPIEDKGST